VADLPSAFIPRPGVFESTNRMGFVERATNRWHVSPTRLRRRSPRRRLLQETEAFPLWIVLYAARIVKYHRHSFPAVNAGQLGSFACPGWPLRAKVAQASPIIEESRRASSPPPE
jgi:hypothetical protein